jgi:ligand-binding SRPBCC domain-containing protein
MLTYRLRPLLGLPASWVTEITHVESQRRFVDEQRAGPYSLWHHEHRFVALGAGTEVVDRVWYALPLGPAGDLAHRLLVRSRLRDIFAFRRRALAARFGELPGGPGRTQSATDHPGDTHR